jgi:putative nucleotidyltransferase with HDIG domain
MSTDTNQKGYTILIVDDEFSVRDILSDVLESEGYSIKTAEDGIEALHIIRREPPDLVITDMKMPRMGGMELLYQINNLRTKITTIMMTGFATVETAVEAIKKGAYDYIMKPFQFSSLLRVIEHAVEKQRLINENLELKETMSLYEISQAISSNLNLDTVLSMFVDVLFKESEADAVGFCVQDPSVEECKSKIVKAKDIGTTNKVERIIEWNKVLKFVSGGKEAMVVKGGEIKQFDKMIKDSSSIESLLLIPMKVKEKSMGFVILFSFTKGFTFTEGVKKTLTMLVSNVSVAIENARLYEDIINILEETVKSFAKTLDAKDKYASGHSERVTRYALEIARAMELPQKEIDLLAQAGLLHDIGKIGISELVLNKNGKLNHEEFVEMRAHPVIGKDILAPIAEFEEVANVIYYHHEHYDGEGYPEGLVGDDIPLLSRIIAVADTYDAMTSTRSYRKKVDQQRAIEEIENNSGSQFDPKVVDAFLKIAERLDNNDVS